MTVGNNLVIGFVFRNFIKWLSLCVYNHISGGQMALRNVAGRVAQGGWAARVGLVLFFGFFFFSAVSSYRLTAKEMIVWFLLLLFL